MVSGPSLGSQVALRNEARRIAVNVVKLPELLGTRLVQYLTGSLASGGTYRFDQVDQIA
jgi:hypothetical protein